MEQDSFEMNFNSYETEFSRIVKASGLTVKQFSLAIGMNQVSIYNMLAGRSPVRKTVILAARHIKRGIDESAS